MTEKRALRGDDVFHMELASLTGLASPFDAPVTLDEVAAYVMAKIEAAKPAEPAAPAAQ